MSKLVLLDVDGVLCDFVAGVMRSVATCSDERADLSDWDFLGKLSPHAKRAYLADSAKPGFCYGLDPLPGAVEGVQALRDDGHDLVAVTAPLLHCPTWEGERREWLRHHFGFSARDVVFTSRKDLVHGDVLVDDKPAHITDWSLRWGKCGVLWAQPYNSDKDCQGSAFAWRTNDWQHIREYLRRIHLDPLQYVYER